MGILGGRGAGKGTSVHAVVYEVKSGARGGRSRVLAGGHPCGTDRGGPRQPLARLVEGPVAVVVARVSVHQGSGERRRERSNFTGAVDPLVAAPGFDPRQLQKSRQAVTI